MSVMTLLREVGSPLTIFNLKWRKRTKPFDTGDIENRRWLGWTDLTYHDELARRKKCQLIRKGQRQFLKNTLQAYPKHHKLICEMYKISNATYQRIKREYEDYWYYESIKSCTGDSEKKNCEMARIIIQKLVTPPWAPTTIEEIKQRIWQDLNVMYSPHTIKAFVKKELRWSYKKGCPRPNKYKTKKIWVSKALFCIDLINLMSTRRIIINIDESSFDRSMKRVQLVPHRKEFCTFKSKHYWEIKPYLGSFKQRKLVCTSEGINHECQMVLNLPQIDWKGVQRSNKWVTYNSCCHYR